MGCSFRFPFVGTKAPSLHTLLFQLQAVAERLAHTLGDLVITVGVGVKCDGVDLRHIDFSIHHNALVGSDIDHLADDAASVFIVLILDEPALQADRELVDDRGIYGFCFAGGQTAAGKFIGDFIAGTLRRNSLLPLCGQHRQC